MELHHPDFAELTQLRGVGVELPSRDNAQSPLAQPRSDENFDLALHAWN